MKKIFTAVCVMALVCTSIFAQSTVTNVSVSDTVACKQYLAVNPLDTIVGKSNSGNKVTTTKVYLVKKDNGKYTLRFDNNTKEYRLEDSAADKKLDSLAVETQFTESLYKDQHRDNYVARREGKPDVYLGGANSYGWSAGVHAGGQFAEHTNGVIGGVDLQYSAKRWDVTLRGELGLSKYNFDAEKAGETYLTGRVELMGGLKLFTLGNKDRDENSISLEAGFGAEHYSTNSMSREDETGYYEEQSEGNFLYPKVGLRYEHRFFGTGNKFYIAADWSLLNSVVWNASSEKYNAVSLTVGFNLGIGRNKVKNVSSYKF